LQKYDDGFGYEIPICWDNLSYEDKTIFKVKSFIFKYLIHNWKACVEQVEAGITCKIN
jgi:hypothetical protein